MLATKSSCVDVTFVTLKVLIHKAEEGGYWAEVPALPGCVSQGETGRGERIVIPIHGNQPLKQGLLRSLMKIAGLRDDDL